MGSLKIWLLLCLVLMSSAAALLLLPGSPLVERKQTIYIALVGPMSGLGKEIGQDMRLGVELCLEQMRKEGILADKNIKLLIYNDRDKRTAVKIASQIADQAKALLVLGHYSSSEAIAAGRIYKNNGIPAVTASATTEAVTEDNDWYFRIVPDNSFMQKFIAHSVKNLLGSQSASIIYDNNEFGLSLAEGFKEEAEKIGINIRNNWVFDSQNEQVDQAFNYIIGNLRAAKQTGPILSATSGADGVQLFAACRYPGTDYTVVGPDSFATPTFISWFNQYSRERESPGYYSNGIYAVAPFLAYLADKDNARLFRRQFFDKYDKEPSWVAAGYYDAALVALKAIERAEIQGQDIREDRRRVRKALNSFNEPSIAVHGVTGDIFFDEHGGVTSPLTIGVWHNQNFIPTFSQYQLKNSDSEQDNAASERKRVENTKAAAKDIHAIEIAVNGLRLTPYRVVFAGVDINEVSNINMEAGTFTADFYLWFRFRGDFNDRDISFTNAVKPITLGTPILEEINGSLTVRSYRVQGIFSTEFDMGDYPLDCHVPGIRFQHNRQGRDRLIYVPDVAGLPGAVKKDYRGQLLNPIPGWDVADISFTQKISKNDVAGKQKGDWSVLETGIHIQRQGQNVLLLKILQPIAMIIFLLFLACYIPLRKIGIRIAAGFSAGLLAIAIGRLYKSTLPGIEISNTVLQVIYILAGYYLLKTATGFIMFRTVTGNSKVPARTGSAIYLLIALTGIGWLLYSHWLLFEPVFRPVLNLK